MEKNHLIGFILIFATLLTYNIFTAPSKTELAKRQRERDSIELLKNPVAKAQTNTAPVTTQEASQKYGSLAPLALKKDSVVVLENENLKIAFSSKGGRIISATLKKYHKISEQNNVEQKTLVKLQEDTKNIFNLSINNGANITNTGDLVYTPVLKGNQVDFTLQLDSARTIVQTYKLDEKGYGMDYTISTKGMGESSAKLNWVNYLDKIEKGYRYEQQNSTVYFKDLEDDKSDYCSCTGNDTKDLTNKKVEWVANSNQFFNSALISKSGGFSNPNFSTEMFDFATGEDLKKLTSSFTIPIQAGQHTMKWYIGPNEFNDLRAFHKGLEEVIPYGSSIFGSLNRWVIRPFFDFLNKFISSKGLAIILLIFLIKMLLYPLLYKMLHSQAKMAALKPELNKIKEKHKDDMQKQQVESMKVYQEFGVSPFAGCLPMFLQMPIWIALYRYFPASITFRQESFLWSPDLSSFDAFFKLGFELPFMGAHISLFTLLWAVSTLVYTYYSTKDVDMSANPAMKYVQYFMPMMFLGFFNSYASGLTCYMFFSNLINILQTVITKKFVFDETKIRKELEVQKSKPKKKGGFQARLEEAMKMQQQVAEAKKQGKK
jgi:YidC/Oxa1 family membrane protein insertase